MYACNGILFNHESPRRGETFVTRKITRGLANISQGLEQPMYMGNMDSLRDWGHARDYVEMQWLMLQQDDPRDFVIATGQQTSVRDFIVRAAHELGITLAFEGHGLDELGRIVAIDANIADPDISVKPGDVMVGVDERYYRPAEVESLLGDPTQAKTVLGWVPKTTLDEMIQEMVAEDLATARKTRLLLREGFQVEQPRE